MSSRVLLKNLVVTAVSAMAAPGVGLIATPASMRGLNVAGIRVWCGGMSCHKRQTKGGPEKNATEKAQKDSVDFSQNAIIVEEGGCNSEEEALLRDCAEEIRGEDLDMDIPDEPVKNQPFYPFNKFSAQNVNNQEELELNDKYSTTAQGSEERIMQPHYFYSHQYPFLPQKRNLWTIQ